MIDLLRLSEICVYSLSHPRKHRIGPDIQSQSAHARCNIILKRPLKCEVTAHFHTIPEMGATELIFLISLGLSVSVVLSSPKGTPTHYDTDEKYTCAKKLDIFLDHGIIFKYNKNFLKTWPGNAEFRCQTSIYSRTLNTGIIGVIQKMNFRKKTDCLDYIHFSEGNAKKCGEMMLGTTLTRDGALLPPPAFISDFKGPFVKISTYDVNSIQGNIPYTTQSERTNLVVAGAVVQPQKIFTFLTRVDPTRLSPGDGVELEIAFTAYKDCEDFDNSEELFNCGYGVCILSIFVNDGIVNCPFGDCRDEGNCDQALESLSVMEDGKGAAGNVSQPGKWPGIMVPSIRNFTRISHRNIHPGWEGHTKYAQQTLEEVKSIGSAFEKHNVILERMSGIFESAVQILKEKE